MGFQTPIGYCVAQNLRLNGTPAGYTYFVDVLQRVGQHPAKRVPERTPRLRKQHFAEQPLRSDLHGTAL